MRRVAIGGVEPGMVLARSLFNERGDVLLAADTALTDGYIAQLRERGYRHLYVGDPDTDDIVAEDVVSEHLRARATLTISRFLETVEQSASRALHRACGGSPLDRPSSARGDFRRAVGETGVQHALYDVVEDVLDEVLAAPTLTGLGAIKSHDNYTFCHSLDVAVTAIVLGQKLHLDHRSLRDLALGCVVHDVGKIFVDPAILNKPGPLTPGERAEVEKHPALGYELLHLLQPGEILANHVAYQHHERQDGRGYPRRLRGSNQVSRESHQGPAHIALIAEIASVADVYDAQAADRPYRPALPPERLAKNMRQLAGTSLNREIVAVCLATVPLYPLGMEVVVTIGPCPGWRGVVARQNPACPGRPLVRLLWKPGGERVPGHEIDLAREPEVEIASVLS